MKTDIAIQAPTYQAAERLAGKLGMTLSELYEAALSAYIATHQESVTETLNRVYETEPSAMEPALMKIQLLSVGSEQW